MTEVEMVYGGWPYLVFALGAFVGLLHAVVSGYKEGGQCP